MLNLDILEQFERMRNEVVITKPDVRDQENEAWSGLTYILGVRTGFNLPLKIYAATQEFTDQELDELMQTPLGKPFRAKAVLHYHLGRPSAILHHSENKWQWCVIMQRATLLNNVVAITTQTDAFAYHLYTGVKPGAVRCRTNGRETTFVIDINAREPVCVVHD